MSTGVPILVEGFVVARACEELERLGWTTTAVAATADRGDDIIARRRDKCLRVEAKGAGSSRTGTRRYGRSFNAGQVTISVGQAFFKAMQILQVGDLAGVALPDIPAFRAKVATIASAAEQLGIAVFWVDECGAVLIENADLVR